MDEELFTWTKKVMITIGILVVLYLFYHVKNIFFIVWISGFLVILLNPLVRFWEQKNISPVITLVLVYICIGLIASIVIGTIIPIVLEYITQTIKIITDWANHAKDVYMAHGIAGFHFHPYVERVISWIFPENSGFDHILDLIQQNAGSIQTFFTTQISNITSWGVSLVSSVGGTVANWALVAIMTFLMTLERDRIGAFLLYMLPLNYREYARNHFHDVEEVLASWIKAMLLLSGAIFFVTYVGLISVQTVFGFDLGRTFTLALISGIMEFIPYIGPLVALVPAAIIALGIGWQTAFIIIILYIAIQQIENNFLVPYVMSKSLDLSPFFVFLVVLIGATIAGVLGIVIAVPLAAVITTLMRKHDKIPEKIRKKFTFPQKLIFWKQSKTKDI